MIWIQLLIELCVRYVRTFLGLLYTKVNYYLIVVSFKQLQLTNSLDGVLTESFRKTKHVTETLKR